MALSKSDILNTITKYILVVVALVIGWFAHEIYINLDVNSIAFKSNEDVSVALDERGRLHIVDLETQKTIILQDTVAYAIHSQISNQIYSDYLKKTEQDKKTTKK